MSSTIKAIHPAVQSRLRSMYFMPASPRATILRPPRSQAINPTHLTRIEILPPKYLPAVAQVLGHEMWRRQWNPDFGSPRRRRRR
jgi:hypothetical protein